MKNARETALLALYEVEYKGAYSNIALKNCLKGSNLDARDKALCTSLFYGVISRRLTLDAMLGQLSRVKPKKISKYIRLILLLGLYQIKFADKIPVSAAVNESVRLAKRYGHSSAAGFVNALLKNAAKTEFDFAEPSVKYSAAKEVCDAVFADYPDRAEQILAELNEEPVCTLRANRLKISRDELCERLGGEPCGFLEDALYIKRTDISQNELYAEGLFTVQDLSPMLACRVLAPMPGDTVVDACAAPGGKTTYLAELMQNRGKIFAFDLHEHRAELIAKNAKRLGINIIEASCADARVCVPELVGTADRVLADVPCSGIGIARRKPELKYKTDNDGLPGLQLEILSAAAKYLKPGGVLVYSTCTLYKRENGGVLERFLRENPDFEREDISGALPEGFKEDNKGEITVMPGENSCDGFYIAKIKRHIT